MSAAAAEVLTELRGGVLVVTLNRPEKLNAWTATMAEQFGEAIASAAADPEVRVIVVTGAGRAFCAGADMGLLAELSESSAPVDTGPVDPAPVDPGQQRPTHLLATIDKPVIAAVNGAAAGLGFVQALYADVRFASPQAVFLTAFARRGLIAEYGASWLLPRLVGAGRAADLLLSGRRVEATEAHRIGLVDHLVTDGDVVEAAVAYAEELVTWCSPTSMKVIKQQFRDDADRGFCVAVADAERLMVDSFAGDDLAEGVASFTERREPRYGSLAADEI